MDRVKLGSLCIQITDGEHGTVKDDPEGTYYYLNNNNITESGIVIRDGDRRIGHDAFNAIRKRTNLEANDVVIATCGTLGKTQVIRRDPNNFEFSRSVGIIKPNPSLVLADYIHYYFSLPASQLRIQQIATGGVQKHFYIEDMENFEIDLPPLKTQREIVEVLTSIDKKIANNKNLIAELQETTRLIYDYWFTQFDFPDENGRPYRSSGGKMVWSDELKREIPADWKAGMLSAVCRYADETIAANALDAQTYISLDNMMPNYGGITASEYCPSEGSCKSYRIGDTLLGNIRPYFKKVFQASRDGGCSPDVLVIRPTNGGRCYVYDTIARDCFIDYVVAGAKGTKMPRGDKDHIMRFRMAIPPRGIIEQYEKLVIQIHEYRSHAAAEDFELRSLRDWLLPMLMNGQLSIE